VGGWAEVSYEIILQCNSSFEMYILRSNLATLKWFQLGILLYLASETDGLETPCAWAQTTKAELRVMNCWTDRSQPSRYNPVVYNLFLNVAFGCCFDNNFNPNYVCIRNDGCVPELDAQVNLRKERNQTRMCEPLERSDRITRGVHQPRTQTTDVLRHSPCEPRDS